MRIESLNSFWKAHCDKAAALAALLSLLLSLLYLAVQIGSIQTMQAAREKELDSMKPRHPLSESQDVRVFQVAMKRLVDPPQLPVTSWTNRGLFFPEERVWCVHCREPISFSALKCPFCGTDQPPLNDVQRDTDGDGIPDQWEIHFGLDPLNPADAGRDNDGSGFTSLEQFKLDADGKPVYDLRDPKSHPPFVHKLYVAKIEAKPFPLRFEGKTRLASGELRFHLNSVRNRTFSAMLNGYVGEEPDRYKVVAYNEKFDKRTTEGSRIPRTIEVSTLMLEREGKRVELVYREDSRHVEYTVHLFFEADNADLRATPGETFSLRYEQYRMIRVDADGGSAVVEDIRDGQLWMVFSKSGQARKLERPALKSAAAPESAPADAN